MSLAPDPLLLLDWRKAQRSWSTFAWLVLSLTIQWPRALGLEHRDYIVQRWTTDNGLPQNRIPSLAQTPDGYLWIGSWFGLTRFDGVRFRVFNRYNTPSIEDESVTSMMVGKDGALYVGVRSGLIRLEHGAFSSLPLPQFLPDHSVWDLATTESGELVIDTGSRTGLLGSTNVTYVESFRFPEEPTRKKLVKLADGSVGSLCAKGIARLPLAKDSDWIRLPPDESTGNSLRAAVNDGQGGYWLGTRHGLFHYAASGEISRTWSNPTPDQAIELLYRDSRGSVWAGIRNKGLHRLRGNVMEPFELVSGQSGPDPLTFLEDRESNLWIGTTDGLFQLRPRFIRSLTRRDGISDDNVVSVAESPNGDVWLATGSGLVRIPQGKSRAESILDPNMGHRSVSVGADGTIWTDLFRGVGLTSIRADLKSTESSFHQIGIESIYTDRDGRLWVGIPEGVKCLESGSEIPLQNLPDAEVRVVHQSKDRAMWFGTWGKGLYRWDNGQSQVVNASTGLANDRVIAIHEDTEGYLWVGTHNGLTRLHSTDRTKPLKSFTTEHGLLDNLINHIVEDDVGALWMSCNRGIFRISRSSLNQVAEGVLTKAACAVYGACDGMASSETNGEHQPAGVRARDGRFWFPTTQGVVVVSPSEMPADEPTSAVVLEEVIIDGHSINTQGRSNAWTVPPGGGRVLILRYTLPTFINSQRAQFRHRLVGLDEQWHEAGEQRQAYFTNLKPGHYEFEILGATAHGIWSQKPTVFEFQVEPRFSQTLYFPVVLFLGGLLATLGCASWRLRWQRAADASAQELKLEQERSRIAADLHDELGSKLTALSLRSRGSGIENELRQTAERLRELVWAVDPKCDSLDGLVGYLVDESERLLGAAGINLDLEIPSPIPQVILAAGVRRHLALVTQEAITNAVRHSGAQRVTLSIQLHEQELRIRVADDGHGTVQERTGGRGLATMRDRMQAIGGTLQIRSAFSGSNGTLIEAILPFGQETGGAK